MTDLQVDPQAALEAAVRMVYAWLSTNVNFFGLDHPDRADANLFLDHLASGVGAPASDEAGEAVRERQKILLFLMRRDGEVVAAGFRQLGNEHLAMHSFGVADAHQHAGIATAALKWMLLALPATFTGVARFGCYRTNQAMLNFGIKYGAKFDPAVPQQRWSDGEDPEAQNAVLLDIPIPRACDVLEIPHPSGEVFHFGPEVDGYTFQILYFGRHPARLKEGEAVIIEQ